MNGQHEPGPWQELWLVFAKAWLPPLKTQERQAMQEDLAGNLRELFGLLEITATHGSFEPLQDRLAAQADQQLLVEYSRLFLAPPVAASLNLGVHVAASNSTAAFTQRGLQILHELGLQQSEQLHDSSDHLAIQLELLAHLEPLPDQAALLREQLARLLAGVQGLHRLLQQRAPDCAYLCLCQLLGDALHARVAACLDPELVVPDEPSKTMPGLPAADPHAPQIDDPKLLRAAAEYGVSAEAMQFIVAQMQAKGLGTEHLLKQSAPSPWQRMTPPSVTSKRQARP